ncbi:MAG: PDDEXK nuclease domain-containing protein [archaeon]
MEELSLSTDYRSLLREIKERIRQAQYQALQAVNKELIQLYWDIGKMIITTQESSGWGKSVVENLSADLQNEFPGIHGFSAANLWRMKNFYQTYATNPKLAPLVREIAWSHNLLILEKCKDELEREFYIRMTLRQGWSKNVLIHQIENQSFSKTFSGQTNFDKTLPPPIQSRAKLAIKDEYTFDFLELGEEYSEREFESAIIGKINRFLIEMNGLFSFVGNQFRLQVSDHEYFIDLLLFHRSLRCLVAVELKVGEFQPEHVGKMQFYLAVLDDKVRLPDENPSIGIILCKTKNRMVVEYALKATAKPVGVSSYQITRQLPNELKGLLPEPEQIMRLLDEL